MSSGLDDTWPPSWSSPTPDPYMPPTYPEEIDGATHTEYFVERVRSHESGICVNPIAGDPPQNASLVRLYAPVETELIRWRATRKGAAPIVPSPDSFDNNSNRLYLRGKQTASIPTQDISLVGHTFTISGWYLYAIVGPEGLSSTFRLGAMPWEDPSAVLNYIPAENFITGILDDTLQQPDGLPTDPDVLILNDPLQGPE